MASSVIKFIVVLLSHLSAARLGAVDLEKKEPELSLIGMIQR
jgi:hypothetical protein